MKQTKKLTAEGWTVCGTMVQGREFGCYELTGTEPESGGREGLMWTPGGRCKIDL